MGWVAVSRGPCCIAYIIKTSHCGIPGGHMKHHWHHPGHHPGHHLRADCSVAMSVPFVWAPGRRRGRRGEEEEEGEGEEGEEGGGGGRGAGDHIVLV